MGMRLTNKEVVDYLVDKLSKKEEERKSLDRCDNTERDYLEYKAKNQDEYRYVKLGQLEDILEGHNIEELDELDGLLWYIKRIKDIEKELGIDLMTFISNYRQLLSLKGRNLQISIEEVQKELEQFDKHN